MKYGFLHNKPRKLQMEISNMCNAMCLGCARIDTVTFNKERETMSKNVIVEPDTVRKLIIDPVMDELEIIEFCGTIDDPLVHPKFFEMLDMLHDERPNLKIYVHTNGSMRNPDYFRDLAQSLNRFQNHSVCFSLDGIGDTHEIYRQRTSYKKIIDNAKAFIAAGGWAEWQFVVFDWNKHQKDQAQKLSQVMGFKKFSVRNDRSIVRFIGIDEVRRRQNGDFTNMKWDRTWGYVGKTTPVFKSTGDLIEAFGSEYNGRKIECNSVKKNMLFISYDSRIWPCCFISNGMYQSGEKRQYLEERIFDNYGLDFNLITKYTVGEILAGDFFSEDLEDSWKNDVGVGPKSLITRCAEVCNVQDLDYTPIGAQEKIRNKDE